MPNKTSKWNVVAADDVLEIDSRNPAAQATSVPDEIAAAAAGDNALKGPDQEHADRAIGAALKPVIDMYKNQGKNPGEDQAAMLTLAQMVQQNFGGSVEEALQKVKEALDLPEVGGARVSEPAEEGSNLHDESQNVSTESVMSPTTGLGETSPSSTQFQMGASLDRIAEYRGKHKKNKTKKHLKGEGPKADKANEVYHAIMRDRDGKGEPTKEEQASAAAIAWSQAEKTMKKKAYFRGAEANIIDSYRGMWGEELVRISVDNTVVDVPRETIEFVSTEVIDPVAELKKFFSAIPEEADTRSQILANIQNLKTAKDIAYRLIVSGNDNLSVTEEATIDSFHVSCETRISNLENDLLNFSSGHDEEYVNSLPKYEIGQEIFASSFSREGDGWMDEVIEKMAAEAEEIDIDKLANEDPLIFVASLSKEVIANASAVQNMAMERVLEAAGPLDEETKQQVVSTYIEKTETARRKALASMKQSAAEEVDIQQKTANSMPDEGLFL